MLAMVLESIWGYKYVRKTILNRGREREMLTREGDILSIVGGSLMGRRAERSRRKCQGRELKLN